jgi:hypothetical protein
MKPNEELGNLKLIIRALHQDVSDVDQRMQVLEQEIRRLHELIAGTPDLVVMRRQQRGA